MGTAVPAHPAQAQPGGGGGRKQQHGRRCTRGRRPRVRLGIRSVVASFGLGERGAVEGRRPRRGENRSVAVQTRRNALRVEGLSTAAGSRSIEHAALKYSSMRRY
jgi:hypothetical protein